MANKLLQKTVAAAFALALPLGAQAAPDLDNYILVDAINGIGTDITEDITLGESVGTANGSTVYAVTSPEEFSDWLAFNIDKTNAWWIRSGTTSNNGLWSSQNNSAALIYNLASNDIDLVKLKFKSGGDSYLTFNDGNYSVESTTENDSSVVYVTMNGGDSISFYTNTSTTYIGLTDIYLYQLDPSMTAVTYTIKYVDEDGSELQDARTSTGVVGDTITLLDTDKDAIYVGDSIKYVYSSDDAGDGIVLTADGATITVTFTEAGTYSYTVTAVDDGEGNTLETISGTAFDQDEVTVYYKEYILSDDGTLYYKANNSSNPYWGTTFTIDGADYSETITYTDSGIDSVLFYTEAEDLDGMTTTSANNADIRNSQGTVAYAATSGEDVTVTTLSAGTYTITACIFSNQSTPANLYIAVGEETLDFTPSTGSTYQVTVSSDEFSITGEAVVSILGGYGGNRCCYDYLYITGAKSDTDGISEVNADVESGDAVSAPVYSLSGVMVREAGEGVSGLGKGVYIMNGKKFMVIK